MKIKSLSQMIAVLFLLGMTVFPAQAAFKSLYIFGDGLSATADSLAPGGSFYYGQRWSNGRVWVEVLAQRQGLVLDNTKNNSYWDHNSSNLLAQVKTLVPPSDVANDLFIVWVCNADTYDTASAMLWNSGYSYTVANAQSQVNHLQIITNLYNKGVRTLILPNAVDLSRIPAFNAGTLAPQLHAACVDYNTRFSNTIAQARALCPGLTIYAPDFFTLMNNALANPANYGLTNALSAKGYSIDAYDDPTIKTLTLNGQGTNYVFWDSHDPTAKFHEVIADVVQQSVSPVQIAVITPIANSNQLVVANVPIGLNGFVDATTNLTSTWAPLQNITSTSPAQSVFVPLPPGAPPSVVSADGGGFGLPPGGTPILTSVQFYRLRFPYAWQWP